MLCFFNEKLEKQNLSNWNYQQIDLYEHNWCHPGKKWFKRSSKKNLKLVGNDSLLEGQYFAQRSKK